MSLFPPSIAGIVLWILMSYGFYFDEVTILIPKTWPANSAYEDAEQESLDTMDVFIEPKTEKKASNAPYTPQIKGCGNMGNYIHLTDVFLTDDSEAEKYEPRGKVLVHEWGHYRFGLFDEYPLKDNQQFYISSDGFIEATRCSLEIDGELYNSETGNSGCEIVDGLPEKACRFRAKSEKKSNYGSLTYKQNLEQITEFCNVDATKKTVHNKETPNKQNIECNGKSAWEVIREHEDYKNSDTATIKDTTPKFKFVRKQSSPKVVLVLDVSGSMNSEGRLIKLRQGCYTLVRFVLSECSEVGIVLFNETAIISRPMTRVPRDPTAREYLANDLPKKAANGTSIGAAIGESVEESFIEFEHKEFEVKVSSPSGTSFNKRTSEEFWCNDDFKTCQFLMAKAELHPVQKCNDSLNEYQ
ncbi:hypothetical protein CAPTEDRAFT_194881 [Capitella teleta]|uniref:Calcium-activated chloride channel N-terminal domain-containing protein n=1 Tax=Capitella teleta TaxID=283909 RepID=R7TSI0_CAPTE|nr:hypothetical protein CAPTEDRAFT_194881 [Capitella teleta]|eukprot:ELT94441.1 hypothetical protein CAPTEDRAFT_194881 [Capitella teleta]